MSEQKNHFQRAYALSGQAETDALYHDWAATYDAEVLENGYKSPERCAEALAKVAGRMDLKILDIGCGTGFGGAALRARGFTDLTGCDPNASMLAIARKRGVYRDTWQTDLSDPYPFRPGTYDAIAAIGVIGSGAAPASALPQALSAVGPGGLMVFSLNDHTLANPEYTGTLEKVIDEGTAEQLFREHGDHLTKQNIGSDVVVLRKT